MSDALIKKYNIPVPRYTSYPPANLFTDKYTADDLTKDIIRSNEMGSRSVSYYIHTPFCRQICHYCACNKQAMPKMESEVVRYFQYIYKEIQLLQRLIDPERPIAQIHFGGGSPSSVPFHFIAEVLEQLTHGYALREEAEIAIEAHPGFLSKEQWSSLIGHSFNRFSIGVQDFNPEVLRAVNRRPSEVEIREVVERIQDAGKRVNLDFIYGLPLQTPDSFERTIEHAVELRPNRLVTFSYAHVPWIYPQQKMLEKAGLPGVDEKKEMYDRAATLMTSAGYVQVGLDHFVLPDDPLALALKQHTLHRNFQGYCPLELSGQVYALGITGISQLHNSYAQSVKDLPAYYNAIDHGQLPTRIGYKLSLEESLARDIITDLMCNYRTSPLEHARRHGLKVERLEQLDILQYPRLLEMANDGIVSIDNESILTMNPEAHLFVRNVASTFDIHYHPENPKGYSNPI